MNNTGKYWSHNWKDVIVKHLGGTCIQCGSTENLHLHHTLPIYAGGANDMSNLEPVCQKCHRKLHTQLDKIYPKPGGGSYKHTVPAIIKENEMNTEEDKMRAIVALRELVESGAISKDIIPEDLKGSVLENLGY